MANSRIGRKAFQALFNQEDRNDEIIYDLGRMTKRKEFASWVRDMWRLWKSLAKSETSVLIELFPDFTNRLTTTDGDKLLQSIFDQQAIILKKLEAGIPTQPMQQTGKLISAPNFTAPDIDDDDLPDIKVKVDAKAAGKTSNNFLDAALGIQAVQTPH